IHINFIHIFINYYHTKIKHNIILQIKYFINAIYIYIYIYIYFFFFLSWPQWYPASECKH
ncbi:MAG: hypothetical protein N7Q72_03305, partial [Spiroplasma sp. Tabriz.8]|nr:hypothetical protein [Spiroplasma sp. Tabriz.8]